MKIEFENKQIPFESKKEIELYYEDRKLKQKFKPDFICYDKIIIEIKAISKLLKEHEAQVLNYLNATGLKLGILIKFRHYPKLEYERTIK